MKSKIVIILSMIFFSFPVLSHAQHKSDDIQGIKFFEGTWEEALQKAKTENKPIFMDVWAIWCGPCKVLKKKTFPDAKVGEYFNKNFINVSLNGEKSDGIKVVKDFNIQAYPSLFILNSSGTPVVYFAGYLKPEELIEFGKAGLKHL